MISLFNVLYLSTSWITVTENALMVRLNKENIFYFSPEINATGFNYQNEDEKVTLSFPSTLQKGQAALVSGRPCFVKLYSTAAQSTLQCNCPLYVCCTGSGTLKIDFVGELNDKMKGFYRSKYTTSAGEIRYAAVTQFEVK